MEGSALKILLVFILFKMHYAMLCPERVVCTAYQANFSQFDVCEVRRNKANIPAFYMKLRLLQIPITNCLINVELRQIRLSNTILVFSSSWDACKILENSKKYPSFRFFYRMITKYSNMNHTCPYNHDIVINDLAAEKMFLPMPKGKYVLKSNYNVDGVKQVSVDIYLEEK